MNEEYLLPDHIAPNIERFIPVLHKLITQHKASDFSGVRFTPINMNTRVAKARMSDVANWIMKGKSVTALDARALRDLWKEYRIRITETEVRIQHVHFNEVFEDSTPSKWVFDVT